MNTYLYRSRGGTLGVTPEESDFALRIYQRNSFNGGNISERHWDALIADAVKRRTPLASRLEMPADGRIILPMAATPESVRHVIAWDTLQCAGVDMPTPADVVSGYTTDRHGRKVRVGRLLLDKIKRLPETDADQQARLTRQVDNLLAVAAEHREGTRVGVISVNPVDSLLASERAPGWDDSSCYRAAGRCNNMCIALARSSRVLIGYVVSATDPDPRDRPYWQRPKLSRVWIHLPKLDLCRPGWPEVEAAVWLARNYGSMAETHRAQMAHELADRLSRAHNLTAPWEHTTYVTKLSGRVGYADTEVSYGLTSPLWGNNSSHQGNAEVAKAMCLVCGTLHRDTWEGNWGRDGDGESGSGGQTCESCATNTSETYRCSHCGDAYDPENGGYGEYCDDCGFSCDRCNDVGHNDSSVSIRVRGQSWSNVWCEHCANNHATRCEDCEEYYKNDDMTTVSQAGLDDIEVCGRCYDLNWLPCACDCGCGNYCANGDNNPCDDCAEECQDDDTEPVVHGTDVPDPDAYASVQDHPNQISPGVTTTEEVNT